METTRQVPASHKPQLIIRYQLTNGELIVGLTFCDISNMSCENLARTLLAWPLYEPVTRSRKVQEWRILLDFVFLYF